MSAELRVSLINGENVLLLNGFRIEMAILDDHDQDPVIVYRVLRKGMYLDTYTSLQDAVEWCKP